MKNLQHALLIQGNTSTIATENNFRTECTHAYMNLYNHSFVQRKKRTRLLLNAMLLPILLSSHAHCKRLHQGVYQRNSVQSVGQVIKLHSRLHSTYLGNSCFAVKSLKLATGCPMVGINAFAQHIVSSFSSFFLYIIIFSLSIFVSVSFLTKSIRISRVCISNEKLFTWIFNYNSTDAEIGFYTNLDRHPIQIPL